ncbi:hypothetical protein C8R42DRAFT_659392 [Lentinula raphanica]|nr:hypothetical protein C8R42DRAFT_659392 [Lentinula raphanica]
MFSLAAIHLCCVSSIVPTNQHHRVPETNLSQPSCICYFTLSMWCSLRCARLSILKARLTNELINSLLLIQTDNRHMLAFGVLEYICATVGDGQEWTDIYMDLRSPSKPP